jgi:CheY-like chemotaxis protein
MNQGMMRVVVVEDDPVSNELLCNALEQFGYEVHPATNGEEALTLLRTGQFRMAVSD